MAYGTINPQTGGSCEPTSPALAPNARQYATETPSPPSQNPGPATALRDEPESRDEPSVTLWQRLMAFYDKNIGLFFVFLAQMFGSLMTLATRLLVTSFETKFHALQVIFVRMLATSIIGSFYLWYKKVPGFPFGPPEVRWLLIIRGVAGTAGIFGSYTSLKFLDISDATVISFLVPTLTAFVCWIALNEPFTAKEASAGVIAFAGVLFIARPSFLFPSHSDGRSGPLDPPEKSGALSIVHATGGIVTPVPATPSERSFAVLCAVLGSFSAAAAYATIRVIGKRVHSLVSVNYFAVLAMVSSFVILLVHPDLEFKMPQSTLQWFLLAAIGLSGFLLQVLLTEGLQREKAGRATNLIYTQLVFALVLERIVWGTTPPIESFIGSFLIIGAAIWVSVQNKTPSLQKRSTAPSEESGLLATDSQESPQR